MKIIGYIILIIIHCKNIEGGLFSEGELANKVLIQLADFDQTVANLTKIINDQNLLIENEKEIGLNLSRVIEDQNLLIENQKKIILNLTNYLQFYSGKSLQEPVYPTNRFTQPYSKIHRQKYVDGTARKSQSRAVVS